MSDGTERLDPNSTIDFEAYMAVERMKLIDEINLLRAQLAEKDRKLAKCRDVIEQSAHAFMIIPVRNIKEESAMQECISLLADLDKP